MEGGSVGTDFRSLDRYIDISSVILKQSTVFDTADFLGRFIRFFPSLCPGPFLEGVSGEEFDSL